MRVEFNDPGKCFGSNAEAVEKVVRVLALTGSIRCFKSKGRIMKNAGLRINCGPDKWQTKISIIDNQGRTIGWYSCGEIVGILGKPLEIIYFN